MGRVGLLGSLFKLGISASGYTFVFKEFSCKEDIWACAALSGVVVVEFAAASALSKHILNYLC